MLNIGIELIWFIFRHFADPMMESTREMEGNEGVKTFISDEQDWCSASIWKTREAMRVWVNSDLHKVAVKISTDWIKDIQFVTHKTDKRLEDVSMSELMLLLDSAK